MQNNNFNPEKLKNMKGKSKEELMNMLSNEDKAKLNSILSDKAALEKVLKSAEASAILKMLGGK